MYNCFDAILDISYINWKQKIYWDDEETQLILEDPDYGIFLSEHEKYYHLKMIDPKKNDL